MQWLPAAVFAGALCLLGVVVFLLGRKQIESLLIPTGVGILLGLFLFSRVRFGWEKATLWHCTFFPVTVFYADLRGVAVFCSDRRYPECPTSIVFRSEDGKIRAWSLAMFSPRDCARILAELHARCPDVSGFDLGKPDLRAWCDRTRHVRSEKIACGIGCIFFLLLGTVDTGEVLCWRARIRSWDKAEGVILKNEVVRVRRSGRRTAENVSRVEYRYEYGGRVYTGSRIVYDSRTFPPLEPGTKRQVIVDPEDPGNSAIMFRYRGAWWVLLYAKSALFFLFALVLGCRIAHLCRSREIVVPEALERCFHDFPGGESTAAQVAAPSPALPAFFASKRTRPDFGRKVLVRRFRNEETPFSDLKSLRIRRVAAGAALFALTRSGAEILLCRTNEREFGELLELLPELAARLGNLPVAAV